MCKKTKEPTKELNLTAVKILYTFTPRIWKPVINEDVIKID